MKLFCTNWLTIISFRHLLACPYFLLTFCILVCCSNFFNGQSLNGFHRSQISPVAFPPGSFGHAMQTEANSQSSLAAKDIDQKSLSENSKRINSTLQPLHPPAGNLPPPPPHHLLPTGVFPGLMDISSTQVLLNMVRNASSMHQNALSKPLVGSAHQQIQKQVFYHQQQLHQQQQQENLASKQSNSSNSAKPEELAATRERSPSAEVSLISSMLNCH